MQSRLFKLAGIGFAACIALAACGSTSSHGTGGGGGSSTSTSTGTGGTGGSPSDACTSDSDCISGGTCDTSTGVCQDPPGTSCQQCACMDLKSQGGCADVCKMGLNGTSTPNFCDGISALSQCSKCLADKCGSLGIDPADPSACM